MAKAEKSLLDTLKDSEASTSIIFGGIVVIVVGLLIYNLTKSNTAPQVTPTGLTTEQTQAPNENGYVPPTALPTEHVVVKGEHLWGIAEKYYGSGYNFIDIQIANPNSQESLAVGEKLTIPAVTAKKSTVATVAIEPVITAVTNSSTSITGESYVVQKADSLWNIAVRAYGDGYKWVSIYNSNKELIRNPGMIDVGWTLKLPR
jgi:nucleoid-associated protein YgaU